MTANTHTDTSPNKLEPITDTDALRNRDDVSYHENVDTVSEEVVARMTDLPDLASVGTTNDGGQVLFRRLTEDCSWKVPTASVACSEDFAGAICGQVSEAIGLSVDLVSIAGVWNVTVETEDGNQSATRTFVAFEDPAGTTTSMR